MMRKLFVTWSIVAVVLLAGCAPLSRPAADPVGVTPGSTTGQEAATAELIPVELGVGFIPSVQFAPFYVGIEKGFYRDAGLDVTLDYGFENDYLKLVGTDELQFMVGSGDQVVLGRAQGLPVRYVMNWFSRYPVVVFAKESAGITEPADLAGKRIGIPGPFGASYVAFRGILDAAGLSEADVTLESIGFTQAAAVSEETVDAAVDYGVNGPVVLALDGIQTTQIALDNYLRVPANGLVTNETTLERQPELVAAMVDATMQALRYTLENPDEAFAIALDYVPEAGGANEAANRAVFDASLPIWTPDVLPLGMTAAEDWRSAAEFMMEIGLVDTAVAADELYTNEFVEE